MRDPHLYKIVYDNGKVKYGRRTVLGPVIGAMKANWGYRKPVAIGRAIEPEWEDVTSEFIPS